MDFIERMTGLSPDNGDGSTEMLFFIAVVMAIVIVARPLWTRLQNRRRPR
jgi:hypothetical protein